MPPREVPYLVEQRNISGRGLLKIPASDLYRHLYFYVNVVRLPRTNFTNSKFNPDRSEYAKICWVRNGYVIGEEVIHYESQLIEWSVDATGYLASAMVCMHDNIISYMDYLAPYIPAPPLPDNPANRIWVEPLRTAPHEARVVCRADTSLNIKLYALNYDVTCPDAYPTPKLPPDPPIPAKSPVGVGVGVSPPYLDPNDNGNTIPLGIDSIDYPTVGNQCGYYVVTWSYKRSDSPGSVYEVRSGVWGPIGRIRMSPTQAGVVQIECRGSVPAGNCVNFGWYGVQGVNAASFGPAIVKIE